MSKQSLKQVYASYAPKVLDLLADDQTHMRVFGAELMLKIHDYKNAKDKDVVFEQSFMPLFMDKLYPSAQKNAQIAAWLCKVYLNHRHNGKAILAEDFYKVVENLKYFDALKNSKSLPEKARDLLSYQSYQELLDVLKPFEEKRMAKEAEEAFRKLSPEQKQIIKSETTILYDGVEGQVVIPHTPRASQFWGSNTKWCIAGKEYAEIYFPDYNKKSPIVMIIPKGMQDQKIALVEQTLWDAEDKKVTGLPEVHFTLFQKMLASHPADIARDIRALIKNEETPEIPEEWRGDLKQICFDIANLCTRTSVSPLLLANKAFMLAAVKQNGLTLYYALQEDEDLVMAAVKQNGEALYYADDRFRVDAETVLKAVHQNGRAFRYAAHRLQNDISFAFRCAKENIHCLEYADEIELPMREAMRVRVAEDLMREERMTEAKKAIVRHEKESWGDVTAQFGDDVAKLWVSTNNMRHKLSPEAQMNYAELVYKYSNQTHTKPKKAKGLFGF